MSKPLESKKAHIKTFGCQMNEHDTMRMYEMLGHEGYEITEESENADLVLLNTCSVRENPENKVYSLLGRLSILKRKKPELIIGVGGCVAQQEASNIIKKNKDVDLVFGTDTIFQLPKMLERVNAGEKVVNVAWQPREKTKTQNFIPEEEIETGKVDGCKGYIAITKGCDNFCTYCIVPFTRGRLVSREPDNIIQEAQDLIQKGAKEIMLLGQNVNSYFANDTDFHGLLKRVADLDGLERLRFTSPHPNDWDNKLSDLVADHPTICKHLHLPVQSGSNKVLSSMRRKHSAEDFLKKVDYLKSRVPDIVISTDLIVGFPGETDEDFNDTMKVIEHVQFCPVYAFKYSTRPGTKAAALEDDVPLKIKQERLEKVISRVNTIQDELLTRMLGTTQAILIDSAHPKERGVMKGRTGTNLPVSIADPNLNIGDLIQVKIVDRKRNSLIGKEIK